MVPHWPMAVSTIFSRLSRTHEMGLAARQTSNKLWRYWRLEAGGVETGGLAAGACMRL